MSSNSSQTQPSNPDNFWTKERQEKLEYGSNLIKGSEVVLRMFLEADPPKPKEGVHVLNTIIAAVEKAQTIFSKLAEESESCSDTLPDSNPDDAFPNDPEK